MKGDNSKPIKVSFDFNGKKEKLTAEEGGIMRNLAPVASNRLVIENESDKPVFVTFTEQGVPVSADMTVTENNLTMKVDYMDMEQKPVDVSSLQQGTSFMMLVSVTNTTFRQIRNLALTKMVPLR
ncbi:MAG: hypothetical protein U5L72_17755 [Bacteroidales bacterium]|nr:hypothetical protein [Bacteroidales bacterium]